MLDPLGFEFWPIFRVLRVEEIRIIRMSEISHSILTELISLDLYLILLKMFVFMDQIIITLMFQLK